MRHHIVAGLVAAVFSVAASADAYVHLSAGKSSLKIDCDGAATCDKSGSAFALFGGKKFDNSWGIEAGYMNFGKARVVDAGATLDVKTTAIGIGAAAFLPLNNWVLTGRLGLASVSTKLDATIAGQRGSETDKNATTYVGLGLGYQVSKSLSIDFGTLVTKSKFNKDGLDLGSGNVRSFTLGLTGTF